MNLTDFKIVRLDDNTVFKAFSCSDTDLNNFLFEDAKKYTNELLAATFLVENEDSIVAYFSLINDSVNLKYNESKTKNRFNRALPNAKRINNYPAIKIGRLAVSESFISNNIGSQIISLTKRWFRPNSFSGCRFILVDAYAAAIPFYIKNGFQFLTSEDQEDDTRLMYFDLKRFF